MKNDSVRLAYYYTVLILLAAISLAPIWVMISTSLKDEVTLQGDTPVWFFFVPTMDNYQAILTGRGKFDTYLINSIIVAGSTTVITLLFGGFCAYALSRAKFTGRTFLANATLLVRMVPPAVIAVPAFAFVILAGIDNDLLALTFLYTAISLPFAIWLLFGFFKQIPEELEEAAIVDGASPLQVFFRVLLPLMSSGYAVAGIFTFRIAWNEFILALLLTGRNTRTLPVAAASHITEEGVEWGRIMAMGTLIVIPPLIFTFFAAKQIIAGMTAGAVKG